jgi:hypothetical protein
MVAERGGTPLAFPPDEARIDRLTPDEAMIYLLFLASHYPNRALPVEFLATVCVSCAKQGQITNAFADKIMRGVEDETGYEIQIDADVVRVLYQHFGKDFTDLTAPLAFNRWTEMLPESALRLRLTIEQITFSRLTVYKVVEEACQTFPDFPWPLMNKLLPGEISRFTIAARLIDGNPYYGFKKNVGEAASTRYKYLGWVAKELLVRGAGKGTLSNYQGWPRTVPNHDRVRQVIDDYLRHRGKEAAFEDTDIQVSHAMLNAVVPNYDAAAIEAIWRPAPENPQ